MAIHKLKTKQAIFNKVARHLIKQNARSETNSISTRRPKNGTKICAYRGAQNRSCAIGCLIADKAYDPKLEGMASGSSMIQKALRASGVLTGKTTQGLLSTLQGVHDGLKPKQWRLRLRDVAENYNLKLPKELRP